MVTRYICVFLYFAYDLLYILLIKECAIKRANYHAFISYI